MLEFVQVTCPYCGESFETGVDASAGSTSYVEDCQVCCKPIDMHVSVDAHDATTRIDARRSDE